MYVITPESKTGKRKDKYSNKSSRLWSIRRSSLSSILKHKNATLQKRPLDDENWVSLLPASIC